MNGCSQHLYQPLVSRALRYRYFTILSFIALLVVAVGLVQSSRIKLIFFPELEQEFIQASFVIDNRLQPSQKEQLSQQLSASLRDVSDSFKEKEVQSHAPVKGIYASYHDNEIRITADLEEVRRRRISGNELIKSWAEKVRSLEGIHSSRFKPQDFDMSIRLFAKNIEQIQQASKELEHYLQQHRAITDLFSDNEDSRPELQLDLNALGQARGISHALLSSQVQHAFQGLEVQRLQLEEEEVKVILRFGDSQRRSIASLENLIIRDDKGAEFALGTIANIHYEHTPPIIVRNNGQRVIRVRANIDKKNYSPHTVARELETDFLPKLSQRYPGIDVEFGGDVEEDDRAIESLVQAFLLSILLIYILLAIPLKSYTQPLLIISIVPFGMIGVIAGHGLLGLPVSILSFFGFLALSGVVINDSLILVTRISQYTQSFKRQESESHGQTRFELLSQAMIAACQQRFRAVMLTSLTTFVGLTPIIFETSYQAQFLIPTAVALGFGILFSTAMTLLLIPAIYMVSDDLARAVHYLRLGRSIMRYVK